VNFNKPEVSKRVTMEQPADTSLRPARREVEMMQALKQIVEKATIEPRDYQIRLAEKSLQMFAGTYRDHRGIRRRPAQSVLIESPTGSGKTIMGLTIASCLQQQEGLRVGWVAMRRNLLAQADDENRRRGFELEMQTISMFDRDPPPVDLLVLDEAQHDGAASMATLHARIQPKKVLGLSATPYRSDRIKLCFEQVIRDAGIHELIQEGYLSPYRHFTVPEYTPETVASIYADDSRRWGKSLLFFHRTQQCFNCKRLLANAGIRSEVVTAQTNRERQISDFAAGKIHVLISMAILAEGFDCPSLQTVFCRPSGKGCTIQMCGRVLRKFAGARYKQILQCRNTRHPFTRTATPGEQFVWVDGDWRSLKLNDDIAVISAAARQLVADCQPELPALVAKHRGWDERPWYARRNESSEPSPFEGAELSD
jgi:superfamily II DNA or RNA helicase